jgi:hypothetical protein
VPCVSKEVIIHVPLRSDSRPVADARPGARTAGHRFDHRGHYRFRAEFYNVFNHTNFSGVDTAAKFNAAGAQTNLTFGQYNAARFPRRIQLALRLMF